MPKVSIVVPVYKVEKYLTRCVRSLINQTLKDIEIILVDDGSPDSCGEICDNLAEKDKRIKVVHKKNGGLSSARNAGIDVAKGETIGFIDSDDDTNVTMFETLYTNLIKFDVDFIMADYIRVVSNEQKYIRTANIRGGYFNKDNIKSEIYPQLIMGRNLDYGPLLSVWHCLYKKDFLIKNQIRFAEDVKWSEDNLFSAIVGYKAKNFYYLKNQGLYHYYNNQNSISTSYKKESWNVYSLMNQYLHDFFDKKKDFDFSYQLKLHMIYYACNYFNQVKNANITKNEKRKSYEQIFNSKQLKDAFDGFSFPKEWNWKLKTQIALLKHKQIRLLELL